MKLGVTLDILNQKDTPAFYADTLANRPAAGFTGRVFISTDTLDLYRDTGTTWVLLSPSSTGTITGAGAAGQVTYFSGTSSITGDNNLFWDSVNGHLGIKTITPDCALDVNHAGTFVAKFNNTTTANTLIGIFNLDNPQWFIGSNSVANDLTFYDATNSPTLVPTTTMKTDGTTFIGGQTTGSGRLNVYSATSDNGIQISGANAPSLRIDNAPTGATKRIGLGISTAVNNFIQGSVDRDMCIFNGSTTASPMLFGIYDTTNVQEAARISAARNFLIGTTTDGGQKLQVNGGARATGYYLTGMTAGSGALYWSSDRVTLANYNVGGILRFEVNGGASALDIDAKGNLGIGISPSNWSAVSFPTKAIQFASGSIYSTDTTRMRFAQNVFVDDNGANYVNNGAAALYSQTSGEHFFNIAPSGTAGNPITFTTAMTLTNSGVVAINTNGRPAGVGGGNNGLLWVKQATSGTYGISSIANTTDSFTYISHNGTDAFIGTSYGTTGAYTNLNLQTSDNTRATIFSNGNFRVGTGSDNGAKFQVNGTTRVIGAELYLDTGNAITFNGAASGLNPYIYYNGGGNEMYIRNNIANGIVSMGNTTATIRIKGNGITNISNMPTSSAGLVSGDLWNNSGVVNIIP